MHFILFQAVKEHSSIFQRSVPSLTTVCLPIIRTYFLIYLLTSFILPNFTLHDDIVATHSYRSRSHKKNWPNKQHHSDNISFTPVAVSSHRVHGIFCVRLPARRLHTSYVADVSSLGTGRNGHNSRSYQTIQFNTIAFIYTR